MRFLYYHYLQIAHRHQVVGGPGGLGGFVISRCPVGPEPTVLSYTPLVPCIYLSILIVDSHFHCCPVRTQELFKLSGRLLSEAI